MNKSTSQSIMKLFEEKYACFSEIISPFNIVEASSFNLLIPDYAAVDKKLSTNYTYFYACSCDKKIQSQVDINSNAFYLGNH